MEKIKHWNEMLQKVLGQPIIGLHHDYERQTLVVVLESMLIRFKGCNSVYDFGVMGGALALAEIYEGDFSQLIQLRQRGHDADDFEFCILSRAKDVDAIPGKISIAFKELEFEDNP